MKPIKFSYANITFAKNQPQYQPLPAWTDGNQVVSGWSLSWSERLRVLFTGLLWIRQVTFGQPLQPLRPQALSPFPKMPLVQNDNSKAVGPVGATGISGPKCDIGGAKGPTGTPEVEQKFERMDE